MSENHLRVGPNATSVTESQSELLTQLLAEYNGLEPDLRFRDEGAAMSALKCALQACRQGGYGVGAVIMDELHKIHAQGANSMYHHGYNSGAHAEMQAMDLLESKQPEDVTGPLSLLATLEPCPMCLTRAVYAGIQEVVYIVADPNGGMVHLRDSLPPAQREFAQQMSFRIADVSEPVRRLSEKVVFELQSQFAQDDVNRLAGLQ